MEEDYIRLIFGLKLKQIRTEKSLSLFGLAKITGLSKSYLNEIEKGKKYPKTDKILLLAEKLEVPYDHLVSLKLDKNLAPIGEILQSKILKEIPLDIFGIKESNLIDIVARAPLKVNAFINTIIKIAQNYNLTRESFFLASLRSYQEAHNNYFDDIENQVIDFAKAYQIDLNKPIASNYLADILQKEYHYTIDFNEISKHSNLLEIRSIYISKKNTLLIYNNISEAQKTFIYAKEIAYNYLKIEDRLYTFPWIQFDGFDQVLNNFIASYFAGALIIPKNHIVKELSSFFDLKEWRPDKLFKIARKYRCSDETFYQRLTNILPSHFNIKNLFFLRFKHKINSPNYHLTKELHITQQQGPHANRNNEHYCRRWISLKTINDLENNNKKASYGIQISSYEDIKSEYLVLSAATRDPFKENISRSVSIGILLSAHFKKKMSFYNEKTFNKQIVGNTCETCNVMDCNDRIAAPIILQEKEKEKEISKTVNQIIISY